MVEKQEIEEAQEKLPHNDIDLSVAANLEAAEDQLKSLGGNSEKRSKQPKGHIKRRMIKGRPYYYRVTKVKVDGRWKNKETYLGTRKPRV